MIKWPYKIFTNEGEASILLKLALEKAPSLRADGLTSGGEYPDLIKVAACHDFLFPVRTRYSIDDRWTAIDRIARLNEWFIAREIPGDDGKTGWHGAFIAAALGKGASYLQCGISCYLNLRSRDFAERLQSVSRHLSR